MASCGAYAWSWEIKSVNAKGLDIRFRLPPGWDAVEVPARKRATETLSRGTVYCNLTAERKGVAPTVQDQRAGAERGDRDAAAVERQDRCRARRRSTASSRSKA